MSKVNYSPQAPPDPLCAACMAGWPLHIDVDTGERFHIDIVKGIMANCPTDEWFQGDKDDKPDLEKGDD